MEDQQQEVTVNEVQKGKTTFGIKSLSQPTPMWATWVFRTEFILNKVVLFVIGSSSLLTPEGVKESLVWIAAIDLAIWQLAKFFGVKKEDLEN